MALRVLSVSNSSSGGDWQLDEVAAVRDPPHLAQVGMGDREFINDGQRRVALQRGVATGRVVVRLKVGQLPFQITSIPEQHMVEEFSARCPYQTLDEWM